jgi:hypothetical protein
LAADLTGPDAVTSLGSSSFLTMSNNPVVEVAGPDPAAEAAAPVTGLVKRNVSRANSQGLLAEPGVPAAEGIVMLGNSCSYHYEDDPHQPLVKQHQNALGTTAGQVGDSCTCRNFWRHALVCCLSYGMHLTLDMICSTLRPRP